MFHAELQKYPHVVQDAFRQLQGKWLRKVDKVMGGLMRSNNGQNLLGLMDGNLRTAIKNERGLYAFAGASIGSCVKQHTARWDTLTQDMETLASSLTQSMVNRGFSCSQIMLCLSLVRSRYYFGDIPDAQYDKLASAQVVCREAHEYAWQIWVSELVRNCQNPCQVVAPEFRHVYQRYLDLCLTQLQAGGAKQLDTPQALRWFKSLLRRQKNINQNPDQPAPPWEAQKHRECIYGFDLASPEFAALDNFERREYTDCTSLLLSVQLIARAANYAIDNPGSAARPANDVMLRALKLVDVVDAYKANQSPPLLDFFDYPRSLRGFRSTFVELRVTLGDAEYFPSVDIQSFWVIFGNRRKAATLLRAALCRSWVDRKMESFLQSAGRATVEWKGHRIPAAWAKRSKFFQ